MPVVVSARPSRAFLATALAVLFVVACTNTQNAGSNQGSGAFADIARVLRHPRCLNCHPSGDVPHVGDDRRPHAMNVVRGGEVDDACHLDTCGRA